ncbi:MAG: 2-oxoglutarate dehydrogenase complex dihydrolipoyllysine-residue succinyltransferase [Phycisphaerae bacterium]|jgi:2-oxoglutarate dehydrogenase E2 component (dihydrolipoamide succinyltransferase)|nr:2-oxoglutarate dehydrogenase complex dihydrolipoyllysine-residue succinyltransferase [Phycisphaerae bacterium]HOO16307.1 2-oxoglutarate dehydrogenase complex dihydrolipoyllysine-residue succinyltransferase [Phycisphaerae bacterium]HRS29288.1 2-oxoglutarate dehydrogenase complex dihydrolipoyllysine-residue succinyltransferase [Phycisphaerae bacterium]
MAVELKIPEAGESITAVQIGRWLKSEGDFVQQDEPLVELESDKASMDLPAPVSGRISKLLKKTGDGARVGETIAVIDETAVAPDKPAAEKPAQPSEARAAVAATPRARPAHVMPAARRVLVERGLQAAEVDPTGPGGRLLKEDVQRHVATAPEQAAAVEARAGETPARAAPPPAFESSAPAARQEEAVPMTLIRRRIAERLVESQRNAAILTTFNECDMSAVLDVRQRHGEAFEKKYGIRLGLMSFFVKAAIEALKLFPAVNAEIRDLPMSDGTTAPHIVYKNYYDIGVAVSTDRGLVVPVIRNAERLSFAEVEKAIADLATRARDRKIAVEELQGGTFTISNGGVFGSLLSTPIINPPQSAILGLHVIQDRPVARDGQVVICPMMYLALTYDHRIIDGRESVSFLRRIKECVEDPRRILVEI